MALGDIVKFDVGPEEYVSARVVMLGENYDHSGLSHDFLNWVISDKVLNTAEVVVEVESEKERYMFTSLGSVELVKRTKPGAST